MGDYSELKGHDPAGEEKIDAGKPKAKEDEAVAPKAAPDPVSPKSDS